MRCCLWARSRWLIGGPYLSCGSPLLPRGDPWPGLRGEPRPCIAGHGAADDGAEGWWLGPWRPERGGSPRSERASSCGTPQLSMPASEVCRHSSSKATVCCKTSSSCCFLISTRRSCCCNFSPSLLGTASGSPMPREASCSTRACETARRPSGGPAATTLLWTSGIRVRIADECRISFKVGRFLGLLLSINLIKFLVLWLQLVVIGV
mmetsp:Transcript_106627/g.340229  ORF Transcript_106627/g.340229 Transcript_106627/m.340229 type:complete len:207 (+) Transcript_106627:954-1574(+)